MAKKKAKAKSIARTIAAASKKELIASLIRYRIQDDGINPVNDADLDDLERWIINLLDGYYD